MSNENQPRQESSKGLDLFLLLVCLVVAWPALFLGLIARWQIKQRTTEPSPYWIGMALLGIVGTLLLVTRTNLYPLLLLVMNDSTPLIIHMDIPTVKHFVLDMIPLWERSTLMFPWFVLVLELSRPKNLQASLVAQERQRRAIQMRKSKRAANKVRQAPDQVNGNGVLGALIDNPNE